MTRPIWMRFALPISVLAILLISTLWSASPAITSSTRKIIFIPGVALDCLPGPDSYDTKSSADTFSVLRAHLNSSGSYLESDIRYFSYSDRWSTSTTYSASETRQHLVISATLLGQQIRSWGTQGQYYDIITHSLGGAVAASWATTETDPAVLAAVHSITTLDSPVNGMFGVTTPATYLTSCAGDAGADLQDAGIVSIMRRSVNNIDIITYSNDQDLVVPVSAALLDGGCPAQVSPCRFSLVTTSSDWLANHVEILRDVEMYARIDRVLSYDGPLWSQRNTPTPTLQVSGNGIAHLTGFLTEAVGPVKGDYHYAFSASATNGVVTRGNISLNILPDADLVITQVDRLYLESDGATISAVGFLHVSNQPNVHAIRFNAHFQANHPGGVGDTFALGFYDAITGQKYGELGGPVTAGANSINASQTRRPIPATPGRVTFGSYRDYRPGIHIMNADGSGQTRLTSFEGEVTGDSKTTWSPDGSKVAFDVHGYNDTKFSDTIWVMNVDGSNKMQLSTNYNWGDYNPAWSPDGTKIAFESQRDKSVDIYTMNPDGSNVIRLTHGPNENRYPAWSPDGTKIVFSHGDPVTGQHDLYTMNADGGYQTRLIRLAETLGWAVEPAWSPDGTKIAFVASGGIEMINADGTGLTPLTDNHDSPISDSWPAWSLDGRKIAFQSNRGWGSYKYRDVDIYTMNADGSGIVRVTTEGQSFHPSWSPR